MYQFIGKFTPLPIELRELIFVDYVGYCLFAYYIKCWQISKVQEWSIYVIGLLGLAATVAIGIIAQNSDTAFFDYDSPNVMCFSIALFFFFAQHPLSARGPIASWIQKLSSYTLGVYMVHMWILIQILSRMHRYIENTVSLSITCVIVTFAIGCCITFIIKKIPYIGKWIV